MPLGVEAHAAPDGALPFDCKADMTTHSRVSYRSEAPGVPFEVNDDEARRRGVLLGSELCVALWRLLSMTVHDSQRPL